MTNKHHHTNPVFFCWFTWHRWFHWRITYNNDGSRLDVI